MREKHLPLMKARMGIHLLEAMNIIFRTTNQLQTNFGRGFEDLLLDITDSFSKKVHNLEFYYGLYSQLFHWYSVNIYIQVNLLFLLFQYSECSLLDHIL